MKFFLRSPEDKKNKVCVKSTNLHFIRKTNLHQKWHHFGQTSAVYSVDYQTQLSTVNYFRKKLRLRCLTGLWIHLWNVIQKKFKWSSPQSFLSESTLTRFINTTFYFQLCQRVKIIKKNDSLGGIKSLSRNCNFLRSLSSTYLICPTYLEFQIP